MPDEKVELKKLKDLEVNNLKGKLIEVRRIGAEPIFISVEKKDTIAKALQKADIPTDDEVKVEAIKSRSTKWVEVKLKDKVYDFQRIAVTTKVSGSF